jgi:hypothetical protein
MLGLKFYTPQRRIRDGKHQQSSNALGSYSTTSESGSNCTETQRVTASNPMRGQRHQCLWDDTPFQ